MLWFSKFSFLNSNKVLSFFYYYLLWYFKILYLFFFSISKNIKKFGHFFSSPKRLIRNRLLWNKNFKIQFYSLLVSINLKFETFYTLFFKGILAMPHAFNDSGYIVGTIGTVVIGLLCVSWTLSLSLFSSLFWLKFFIFSWNEIIKKEEQNYTIWH